MGPKKITSVVPSPSGDSVEGIPIPKTVSKKSLALTQKNHSKKIDTLSHYVNGLVGKAGQFIEGHVAAAKTMGKALYAAGDAALKKSEEEAKSRKLLLDFAVRLAPDVGNSLLSLSSILPIPAGDLIQHYRVGKKILETISPALFKSPANPDEQVLQDHLWMVMKEEVTLPIHIAGALMRSKAEIKGEEIKTIYQNLEGARKDLVQLLEEPEVALNDTSHLEKLPLIMQGSAALSVLSELNFEDSLFDTYKETGETISGYSGKRMSDNVQAQLVKATLSAMAMGDEAAVNKLIPQVETLANFYQNQYVRRVAARQYLLSNMSMAAHLEKENGVAYQAYYDKPCLQFLGSSDSRDEEQDNMTRALYEGYGSFASLEQFNDSAMADLTQDLVQNNPERAQAWRQHVAAMARVGDIRDILYANPDELKDLVDSKASYWGDEIDEFKDVYKDLETQKTQRAQKNNPDEPVDGIKKPPPGINEINTAISELAGEISSVKKAGNQWYHFNFFRGKYYVSTAAAESMLGEYQKIKELYLKGNEQEAMARLSLVGGGRVANYWALRQMDVAANQYAGNLFLADAALTIVTGGLAGKVASTVVKKASIELAKRSLLTIARGRALALGGVALNGALFHQIKGISSDVIFHYGLGWKPQADYDPADWKGTLRSIATVGAFHFAGKAFANYFKPKFDSLKVKTAEPVQVEGGTTVKTPWKDQMVDGAYHIAKLAAVDIPVMLGLTAAEKLPSWDGKFDKHALLEELHSTVSNALIFGVTFGGSKSKAPQDHFTQTLVAEIKRNEVEYKAAERLDESNPSRIIKMEAALKGLTRGYENFLGYKTSNEMPVSAEEKQELTRLKSGLDKLSLVVATHIELIETDAALALKGVYKNKSGHSEVIVVNKPAVTESFQLASSDKTTPHTKIYSPAEAKALGVVATPSPPAKAGNQKPGMPDVIIHTGRANQILEHYDSREMQANLKAISERTDYMGEAARRTIDTLDHMRELRDEHDRLEKEYDLTKNPEISEKQKQIGVLINSLTIKLDGHDIFRIDEGYTKAQHDVEGVLFPVEGLLHRTALGLLPGGKGEVDSVVTLHVKYRKLADFESAELEALRDNEGVTQSGTDKDLASLEITVDSKNKDQVLNALKNPGEEAPFRFSEEKVNQDGSISYVLLGLDKNGEIKKFNVLVKSKANITGDHNVQKGKPAKSKPAVTIASKLKTAARTALDSDTRPWAQVIKEHPVTGAILTGGKLLVKVAKAAESALTDLMGGNPFDGPSMGLVMAEGAQDVYVKPEGEVRDKKGADKKGPEVTMMSSSPWDALGKLIGWGGKAPANVPEVSTPVDKDITSHFSKAPVRYEFAPSQTIKIGRAPGSNIQILDQSISREHAEINFSHQENCWLLSEKSKHGTFINGTQVDAQNGPVKLKDGDRIKIGKESFTFQTLGTKAVLVNRNSSVNLVEIFTRGEKKKYVGYVELINNPDGSFSYKLTDYKTGSEKTFKPSEVLTIQNREHSKADTALNSKYVRVPHDQAQFLQGSYNQSGKDAVGMMVRVDYSDPQLTGFLDKQIAPIYDQLQRGKISKEQAAVMAYQVVRDLVPYDYDRVAPGGKRPKDLYSLGDFVKTGVCNERGMLLQVALQYLGIKSEMQKGPVPGGRHAWVEVVDADVPSMKLDPQHRSVIKPGDLEFIIRQDDGTPFAKEIFQTSLLDPPRSARLSGPKIQPVQPIKALEMLLQVRNIMYEEKGREVLYGMTQQFKDEMSRIISDIRQNQPAKVAVMEALLVAEGYDKDGRPGPQKSTPIPAKPRVIVNLPVAEAKPAVAISQEKLEEWDANKHSPSDPNEQQQLQNYKNKKYIDLVNTVISHEADIMPDGVPRYQTEKFKQDLKDVTALAKSKVDADTLSALERILKINGYDVNGESRRANRPNLDRYKGDIRQLGGFLMVEGIDPYLLPVIEKGSIFIGKKVEGQSARDYLPLPDHGNLSEFQAQIIFENGQYFLIPTSSNPVERILGGKSKILESGKRHPLIEGAEYIIGSSKLVFYPKKNKEEIYDIDHVELSPDQRSRYFSQTIIGKEAGRADFNPQETLEQHLDKMNKRSTGFILPDDTHAISSLVKFIGREEEAGRLPKGSEAKANHTVYEAGYIYDELNYIKRDPQYLKRRGVFPALQKDQVVVQPIATPVARPVIKVPPAPKIPVMHADHEAQVSGLSPNEANKARNVELDLPETQIHGPISWETNEGIGYKNRNEDAVVWGYSRDAHGKPQFYVVVLDGMGGHGSGDKAAEIGGHEIHAEMNRSGDLSQAFQGASKSISDQLGNRPDSPGAVAAGFQIIERDGKRYARIAHVGDAAIKVLRKNQNGQWESVHATEDENAALLDKRLGNIKDTLQMRIHPNANAVLNALGLGKNGKGPVIEIELQKGDRIIGMSDGLGDNANTADIIKANTAHKDVPGARRELIQLAKNRMTYFAEGKDKMKQLKDLIKAQSATVPQNMMKKAVGLEPFGYEGYYINKAGELIAPDHKTVTEPWVALTEPAGHWMNSKGHVFNEEGVLVDKYKPDNVSVFVYEEK